MSLTLEKLEGAIKNGQSKGTDNIMMYDIC
jgi:hypothetical protein